MPLAPAAPAVISLARTAPVSAQCVETPLGAVAIVTVGERLRTLRLPAARATHEAYLAAHCPGVSFGDGSPLARTIARDVLRLLAGEPVDFRDVVLDTTGLPAFHVAVYDATRALPPGRTSTYGALATLVGSKGAARAVGQALARNPFGLVVPCHRVLAAGGRAGGFTAEGGLDTKRRILACEGVALRLQPTERTQNTMS